METHSIDLHQRHIYLFDSHFVQLPTFGIVDDTETREGMLSERHIRDALELHDPFDPFLSVAMQQTLTPFWGEMVS